MGKSNTTRPLFRTADGKLPAYAWPGGYPMIYLVATDDVLCPACANGENDSEASESPKVGKAWHLVRGDVYWEGPVMTCDNCNEDIESAYGDPDNTPGED